MTTAESLTLATVGRKVDADDLVGTKEIAERLGVARLQVVHDWIRRYDDFPEPIARFSSVRIWAWSDVKAWARQTGRLG